MPGAFWPKARRMRCGRMSTSRTPIWGRWPMNSALLISGLDCFYGEVQVLHGIGLELRRGEVLCLLGRNGAGKTTLLKAIMGLVPARAGSIMLGGRELTELPPHEVPRAGVAYIPQGRRLF